MSEIQTLIPEAKISLAKSAGPCEVYKTGM